MRTLGIYSLNNFPVCPAVALAVLVVLYIPSLGLTSFPSEMGWQWPHVFIQKSSLAPCGGTPVAVGCFHTPVVFVLASSSLGSLSLCLLPARASMYQPQSWKKQQPLCFRSLNEDTSLFPSRCPREAFWRQLAKDWKQKGRKLGRACGGPRVLVVGPRKNTWWLSSLF